MLNDDRPSPPGAYRIETMLGWIIGVGIALNRMGWGYCRWGCDEFLVVNGRRIVWVLHLVVYVGIDDRLALLVRSTFRLSTTSPRQIISWTLSHSHRHRYRHQSDKMVNVPKTRKTYCKGKGCRKHTPHKVTQYKAGKASAFAQGKRRYDRKVCWMPILLDTRWENRLMWASLSWD